MHSFKTSSVVLKAPDEQIFVWLSRSRALPSSCRILQVRHMLLERPRIVIRFFDGAVKRAELDRYFGTEVCDLNYASDYPNDLGPRHRAMEWDSKCW